MCLYTSRISFNFSPCWKERVLVKWNFTRLHITTIFITDTIFLQFFFLRLQNLSSLPSSKIHSSPWEKKNCVGLWISEGSSKFPGMWTLSYHQLLTLTSSQCLSQGNYCALPGISKFREIQQNMYLQNAKFSAWESQKQLWQFKPASKF